MVTFMQTRLLQEVTIKADPQSTPSYCSPRQLVADISPPPVQLDISVPPEVVVGQLDANKKLVENYAEVKISSTQLIQLNNRKSKVKHVKVTGGNHKSSGNDRKLEVIKIKCQPEAASDRSSTGCHRLYVKGDPPKITKT